jgi:hypothetical protein
MNEFPYSYKRIFEGLTPGRQARFIAINPRHRLRLLQMLQTLVCAEIAVYDRISDTYSLHPKQIKPLISVVEIPAKTTPSSDLGRVRVDWSGRGMSSGSYKVVADKGKFLEIAFELDVERKMTVSKSRTAAA